MHRPSLFSMVFYRTSRPLSTMNFYFFLHISVIPGHTDAVPAAAAASQQKGGAPHGGAQKHQERAEHQRTECPEHQQERQEYEERQELQVTRHAGREPRQRPPDTRKHTVLPVSIRLKSTEKMPTCVSMRAFFAANFNSNLLWQNCCAPKKSAFRAEPRRAAAGIPDVWQGGTTMGLRETRLLRRMVSYARRPQAAALVFFLNGSRPDIPPA